MNWVNFLLKARPTTFQEPLKIFANIRQFSEDLRHPSTFKGRCKFAQGEHLLKSLEVWVLLENVGSLQLRY